MIFSDKFQRVYELAALITMKTRRAIQARLKPYGITFDQFGTLVALTATPGISQRELAVIMETDTTTAMVICDGLEKRGLITRTRSAKDRRTNRLSLTPKGKALSVRAYAAVGKTGLPLTQVLTEEEVDLITPVLEKLANKAKELAQSGKRRST